ncbi:hypothetical protein KUTeg_006831, partial [Tegillarca granosa]
MCPRKTCNSLLKFKITDALVMYVQIDEQVVAELNAEDLGKYLKRYGDCIAAITFAKQLKIAHKTLIQEVKYIIDVIGHIGDDMLKTLFPDVKSFFSSYEQLMPSVSRMLALFNCNPVTTEQNKCLGYLQRFARGRNKKQLKQLLRFLTGSDIICVNKIDVSFIIRHGKGRLPSVHTCGPLLELPSTY